MSEYQIRTVDDLLKSISDSELLEYTGPLEQYLRGLWKVIQESREQTVTLPLIKEILEKAAVKDPAPFNEAWLKFENPPRSFGKTHEGEEDGGFTYLKHTILFQIADLHRMEEAGTLKLNWHGGPAESPSGNHWYNSSVRHYFECAIAGYESHCKSYHVRNEWTERFPPIGRPLDSTVFTWCDLAEILELGRLYE